VDGQRVELLGEVEISGTTLHLRDIALYPVGTDRATIGLVALIRAARTDLIDAARAAGFEQLRISGTRLSGKTPGRIVDLTIDLTREAT
jgi:hypothetical protein